MVYLHIDNTTSDSLIPELNNMLSDKKKQFFVLFYMEGCGPCNATRPEWAKLKNVLSNDFLNKKDVVIVDIDKDLFGKLKYIKNEPGAFPTIRHISNSGENEENYEDANIELKDRTIDSFIEWIKLKTGDKNITKSSNKKQMGGFKTKKRGKSSRKKRGKSINKKRGKIYKRTVKYR